MQIAEQRAIEALRADKTETSAVDLLTFLSVSAVSTDLAKPVESVEGALSVEQPAVDGKGAAAAPPPAPAKDAAPPASSAAVPRGATGAYREF